MSNIETQILRAQMMRSMPEWQREPAIRGGVRMGTVIDARARFRGVDDFRQRAVERVREAGIFCVPDDPYSDGDVA